MSNEEDPKEGTSVRPKRKTNARLTLVEARKMLETLDSDSSFDDDVNDPTFKILEENESFNEETQSDEDCDRNNKQNSYTQLTSEIVEDRFDITENIGTTKKLTRKKIANPEQWRKNVRKSLYQQGKEHIDTTGKLKKERAPQLVDCSKCRFKCCETIRNERRKEICSDYHKLGDFNRQKDFLLSNIDFQDGIKRERVTSNERKRQRGCSIEFMLYNNEGKKVRVCKTFFLKTLCISNGPLKNAIRNRSENETYKYEDKRGKHVPHNKIDDDKRKEVRAHIESFPVVESHYTRRDTKRKYLDQNMNISKMYRLYQESCQEKNPPTLPVKENVYRSIFCQNYNYSFFHPKKDQCSNCVRFGMLEENEKENMKKEYENHIKRKEAAHAAKNSDKERAKNDTSFLTASFDLQSVLQIPSTNASLLYYSRKLCLYNLCIYNATPPNDAWCFCWTEVDGRRGSNEIGTCLYKWLSSLPLTVKEVSLFSDTCGGQNRNQNVACMMLMVVQNTTIDIISHNFLESGHSHMECDSMHAAIEREKKFIDAYTMIDWISVFKRARRKNPYRVKQLEFSEFYDFQNISQAFIKNRKKDESGDIVNWLKIKCLRYSKTEPGVIFYRYNYDEPYKRLLVYRCSKSSKLPTNPPPAYNHKLPISAAKKKDLINLCSKMVIPKEVHSFFDSLPQSKAVTDHLPECPAGESDENDG